MALTRGDWEEIAHHLCGTSGERITWIKVDRNVTGPGFHLRLFVTTASWHEFLRTRLSELVGPRLIVAHVEAQYPTLSRATRSELFFSELFFVFEEDCKLHWPKGTPLDREGRPYCVVLHNRQFTAELNSQSGVRTQVKQ